eukprot:CAMPEP_0178426884 /NCGR_PEP_ID=MMETSP0689_2-20121128/29460_1 /TAXON_ID=160604 /ORGANISM="Amphidinium massartii, Strain CS-259" /LENGTH=368 /DNA_ID=CAMNT_0020048575 /DNA_START=1 /DNA_END=1104 /DNA_ORIENTATION=+
MKASSGAQRRNSAVFEAAARPRARGGAHRQGSQRAPGLPLAREQSYAAPVAVNASSPSSASPASPARGGSSRTSLPELADGPYLVIASQLDALALARTDVVCRLLRQKNREHPWRHLGSRAFAGLELDREGVFELIEEIYPHTDEIVAGRKFKRMDWKGRFRRFWTEVPTFRAPFMGNEIQMVRQQDEVAYCMGKMRTDLLDASSHSGVYLEVDVLANPDNLSLAVVDFEAGGKSSITFNPDTGAVIRERKIQESPRKVEGAYIQPLATTPATQRFQGSMGLFLHCGHLAFFRRCAAAVDSADGAAMEQGAWESTGFITDLAWAEGRQLTPCLAFRDAGAYHVRLVRMGAEPPLPPQRATSAYNEANW